MTMLMGVWEVGQVSSGPAVEDAWDWPALQQGEGHLRALTERVHKGEPP